MRHCLIRANFQLNYFLLFILKFLSGYLPQINRQLNELIDAIKCLLSTSVIIVLTYGKFCMNIFVLYECILSLRENWETNNKIFSTFAVQMKVLREDSSKKCTIFSLTWKYFNKPDFRKKNQKIMSISIYFTQSKEYNQFNQKKKEIWKRPFESIIVG